MSDTTQPRSPRNTRTSIVVLGMLGVLGGGLSACGGGALKPVAVDTRNDACASCRMAVSNPKLAAQIVAAGEETRFFDDIGCLATYVRKNAAGVHVAMFVADHRTGAWIPARSALFTRADSIETPMGSHLVAHADADSRHADGITGTDVSADELFGGTK